MTKPGIIFDNLNYAGSSGIVPILKHILNDEHYELTPFGPEASDRLKKENYKNNFFHWSHDPYTTFEDLFKASPPVKIIFMHRDPRDILVSWAHDMLHQNTFVDLSLEEILKMGITAPNCMTEAYKFAAEWLEVDAEMLVITFDEMKEDILKLFHRILNYLEINVSDDYLLEVINMYSFEKITGKKRGNTNKKDIVRTEYFFRKGISGDWVNHFNDELTKIFKEHAGDYLIRLGYEENQNW